MEIGVLKVQYKWVQYKNHCNYVIEFIDWVLIIKKEISYRICTQVIKLP